MNNLIINCGDCIMRQTSACADCVVTFVCESSDLEHRQSAGISVGASAGVSLGDGSEHTAIVFDMAEQRAVRLFAEAGLVPTLRHRGVATGS